MTFYRAGNASVRDVIKPLLVAALKQSASNARVASQISVAGDSLGDPPDFNDQKACFQQALLDLLLIMVVAQGFLG